MRVELRPYASTLLWPEHSDARLDVAPHAAAECSIVVRDGGRWYDLMDSDDAEPRWTTIANIAGVIPRGAFLPRSRGLEIARSAVTDGPVTLRAAHQWRPVPSWVVDRCDYLVRDIVEALVDDAHAEIMSIVRREPTVEHPSAGVRRLAYLLGVHNQAMANGLDAALVELPPEWWYEAVGACDGLGLADVAALLRRLDPDEPDFELSNELHAEYDRLTASGELARRRRDRLGVAAPGRGRAGGVRRARRASTSTGAIRRAHADRIRRLPQQCGRARVRTDKVTTAPTVADYARCRPQTVKVTSS
jgi:hypothetical protein